MNNGDLKKKPELLRKVVFRGHLKEIPPTHIKTNLITLSLSLGIDYDDLKNQLYSK